MLEFHPENTLHKKMDSILSLPSLGRSGREIRQCYLLRSVERSESSPHWPWGLRQTIVYHSYDIVSEKSVWATVKGNSVVQENICDVLSLASDLNPRQDSFSITLDIHLAILDWCDRDWRWCINDIESSLRGIITKAQTAEIDSNISHFRSIPESLKAGLSRMNTAIAEPDSFSCKPTLAQRIFTVLTFPSPNKPTVSFSNPKADLESQMQSEIVARTRLESPSTEDAYENEIRIIMESLQKLDIFSFTEIQKLQLFSEKAQEALLVIKLNSRVIRELIDYYKRTVKLEAFPRDVRSRCGPELLEFEEKALAIAKNMECRREQLEALVELAKGGKSLVSYSKNKDKKHGLYHNTDKKILPNN